MPQALSHTYPAMIALALIALSARHLVPSNPSTLNPKPLSTMPELPQPNRGDDAAPIIAPAQEAPYYYVENEVIGRFMDYPEAASLKLQHANTGGGGWRNKEGTQIFMSEVIDHTMYRPAEAQYAYINGNTYYVKINITLETSGDQFTAWYAELQVKNIHAGRGDLEGDMEKIKAFYQYACKCGQWQYDPLGGFKWRRACQFTRKWPREKGFAWETAACSENVATITFVQL